MSNLQTAYLPKIRFSFQTRWMENNLDKVWETLCNTFRPDETFSRYQAVVALMTEHGWAERTAYNYASACLAYFVAIPEGGLFKVPGGLYRFHDINGN